MIRGYNVAQFIEAAQQQRQQLESMVSRTQEAKAQHLRARAELERSYANAANDLAMTLLPELTTAAVDRAIGLAGYAPWRQASPVADAQREHGAISARIAAIDADPRFRDRELLRNPTAGSLSRQIAELVDMMKPWHDVLARADHVRLERLLELGYGTPSYNVGWWRLGYYQDWRAARQIAAQFTDKATFSDIAAELARARATIATLGADLERLRREVAADEALERERAELAARRDALPGRHLAEARRRITEHVMTSEASVVGALLASAPEIGALFARASGLAHKIAYLDAIVNEHVTKLEPQLIESLQKIDRDVAKYKRPKNARTRFTPDEFDKRFRVKNERYAKRWSRFDTTYTTVYRYNGYDRVDLLGNLLWWDIMTRGRYDGRYIPEVARFYQSHPGYQYEAPPREGMLEDDHISAAYAAGAASGRPYESPDSLSDGSAGFLDAS